MVRALPAAPNQKSSAVPSVESAVTSENVFDVIVIGTGPAGIAAARAGITTAVVERRWTRGQLAAWEARRKLRVSLVADGYLHENPVRHS
jgi:alkyl hydroperoxide reductase subunit AhpF